MLPRPRGSTQALYRRSFLAPYYHISTNPFNRSLRTFSTPKPRLYASSPKPKPKPKPHASAKPPVPATKPQPPSSPPPPPARDSPVPPDPLNPPASTHPPPLSLPTRPADLPVYKHYYRLGKAYAIFYKTGLSALWSNYRLARSLPERPLGRSTASVHAAVKDGKLSRAQFQLARRAWRDLSKLPPFLLVWIVCGEFTPLVVIFVSELVPRVIWIPKQERKAREKMEARRRAVRAEGPHGFKDLEPLDLFRRPEKSWTEDVYLHYARYLGLVPAWWDRLPSTLVPAMVVRSRVERWMQYVDVDHAAIARDGGIDRLEDREVLWACEERGLDVLDKGEQELRKALRTWMKARTG